MAEPAPLADLFTGLSRWATAQPLPASSAFGLINASMHVDRAGMPQDGVLQGIKLFKSYWKKQRPRAAR